MRGRNLHNLVTYWIRGMLYGVAILFANGTIIQTYLAACGLTAAQIGVHATAINISNVGVTVLFSGLADRHRGGVKKQLALYAIPAALCYGLLASLVFLRGLPTGVIFGAALLISVLQYGAYAMYSLYDYKIPYNLIDQKYYGIFTSVAGIVTGVVSVGVSALFGEFADRYEYLTVAAVGIAAAMGMQLIGGLVCLLHKEKVPENPEAEKKSASPVKIWKMRSFTAMIAPNLARGISGGIISMTAVLALTRGFTEGDTARMVTMASVSVLVGCGLFAVLNKKVLSTRAILVLGAVLMAVSPFMFLGSAIWFLGAYFVLQLGKCFVDYSVPTVLFDVVPYETAGSYHAWRLVLNSVGMAVGSMVTGYLAEVVAGEWLMCAAVLLQLYSSLAYYFSPFMRRVREQA